MEYDEYIGKNTGGYRIVQTGKIEDEMVNHPSHYNRYSIEVIDMMVAVFGAEKVADWCEITAFKYRMRMGLKKDNPVQQDLDKEAWYLRKAEELRWE